MNIHIEVGVMDERRQAGKEGENQQTRKER